MKRKLLIIHMVLLLLPLAFNFPSSAKAAQSVWSVHWQEYAWAKAWHK